MDAEFVVLGSGCFSPAPFGQHSRAWFRNPAGYALRYGEEILLFDFGFGNFRQMVRAGLDPSCVSHVFVTHRHPDHLGDLPALLFYYHYDGLPYKKHLRLYGPPGFKAFLQRLLHAHHPWLSSHRFRMSVAELQESKGVRSKQWHIRAREVPHSTKALAYRFESRLGSFCYSGDTGFDAGLAEFALGVDLFVLECTLANKEHADGHLKVSQALELGRLSQARKILLTHLSAASERDLGRRRGSTKVVLAKDLMRLGLRRIG